MSPVKIQFPMVVSSIPRLNFLKVFSSDILSYACSMLNREPSVRTLYLEMLSVELQSLTLGFVGI